MKDKHGVIHISYRHTATNETLKELNEAPLIQNITKSSREKDKVISSTFKKLFTFNKEKLNRHCQSKYSSNSKRALSNKLCADDEIEKFHRDFILPLEQRHNLTPEVDACELKSNSDFDSGHFSSYSDSSCRDSDDKSVSSLSTQSSVSHYSSSSNYSEASDVKHSWIKSRELMKR